MTDAITSVRCALLQSLDTAFDQRSWHGATLAGTLRGVTARTAARRVHGRKTVWEQVLHTAYWKQRVLNKLTGPARFPRSPSNWPAMPAKPDEPAWAADVDLLRTLHRDLRAAVASMPPKKLDGKTVWLIQGAAAHDLYHAGQIKLLLRMMGRAGD
jgi:hypothetical protein